MPLTRVRGSVWDSTDNIVVNVIENLYDPNISTEGIIFVSGSMSVNDGGGGWYKWEAEEPKANHDGYSTVDPSQGTSSGNGCWIRQNFISTSLGNNKSEVQIATLGQTVFKIHNFVYEPGNGELAIYVNGLRLIPSDYIETDPQTVTLKAPLRAGDEVEIIAQEQPQSGQDVCTPAAEICYDNTNSDLQSENVQDALDELAAREGQPGTSRTEALWINSEGVKTFAWVNNPEALDVFLNGVHLDPQEDYTSDGTTLTLTVALQSADDRLLAQSYAAAEDYFPTFYNRVSWTNSAGIDTFAWAHSPANVNIFLNGSRLVNVMDYTATGNEIILAKALISNNDVLEGFSFTTFNVADAISSGQYDDEQAIQDGQIADLDARTTQLEADMLTRTRWMGAWDARDYLSRDQVLGPGWLMVANKDTSEYPFPQTITDSAWAVFGDTTPTWVEQSTSITRLLTGVRITPASAALVQRIQVWIPIIDPDVGYYVVTQREDQIPQYEQLFPTETGWFPITFPAELFAIGVPVEIYLVTQGQGTTSETFTYNWSYRLSDAGVNPNNPPTLGQFRHFNTNAPDTVYINKTDNDGISRKGDLDTLQAGDTIAWTDSGGVDVFFTLTADPTYYNGAVGDEDFYELKVSPAIAQGSNGSVAMTFTHFLDRPTSYVQIADKFSGVANVKGLLSTTGSVADVIETDDAYGIDVLYQEIAFPLDWDVQAYTT